MRPTWTVPMERGVEMMILTSVLIRARRGNDGDEAI